MSLDHIQIVKTLVQLIRAETYLEVGVASGACFLRVKAKNKFAVDMDFTISAGRKLKYLLRNFANRNNRYFEQSSDAFFAEQAELLQQFPPDVTFIDALHTYQQSWLDLDNTLKVWNPSGFVVMHDCLPPHASAAHPAHGPQHAASLNLPNWTGEWCGDTWKSIVRIRSTRPDLNAFVLDCDYGVGVVYSGQPENPLSLSIEEIDALTYDDLKADSKSLLNLKSPDEFPELCRNWGLVGV